MCLYDILAESCQGQVFCVCAYLCVCVSVCVRICVCVGCRARQNVDKFANLQKASEVRNWLRLA